MTDMTKNDWVDNWEDAVTLPATDLIFTAAKGVPTEAGSGKADTAWKLEANTGSTAFDIGAAGVDVKFTYTPA